MFSNLDAACMCGPTRTYLHKSLFFKKKNTFGLGHKVISFLYFSYGAFPVPCFYYLPCVPLAPSIPVGINNKAVVIVQRDPYIKKVFLIDSLKPKHLEAAALDSSGTLV